MKQIPYNVSLEQAQSLLEENIRPMYTEIITLSNSLNRVVAKDIISTEYLPPFPRSAFDGYAFRAAETELASQDSPVRLQIIEEVRAGYMPILPVKKKQAAKILTGAPIPEGADAVIKFENVKIEEGHIFISQPHKHSENVIPMGEDIVSGEMLAQAGTLITAPLLSLFAALGISELTVYASPRIGIISTGDEIVELGEPRGPANIRNSSRYYIEALVKSAGAEAFYEGIARDNSHEIAGLIEKALGSADMIISTGGVSVGDYDMVRNALESLGAEILFHKMAVRHGGAVLGAKSNGKLILGLSGSPAAAAVGLHLLGIPFIRTIGGRSRGIEVGEKIRVYLMEDFNKVSCDRRFIWGKLMFNNEKAFFHNTGRQGSGILKALCGADLLGEIPAGTSELKAGTMIDAYRI